MTVTFLTIYATPNRATALGKIVSLSRTEYHVDGALQHVLVFEMRNRTDNHYLIIIYYNRLL